MLRRNKDLDKKIQKYIDNQFKGVKETQHLIDIKEEIFLNLREHIVDMVKNGNSEEVAFEEAVQSLGDLSGLVEEMRLYGDDKVKQSIHSKVTARISTAGIITGTILVLFGIFTSLIVYFITYETLASLPAAGLFIVIGTLLITYSLLTRETKKRFAMNKFRALFYAIAVGTFLFGLFISGITLSATGQVFIALLYTYNSVLQSLPSPLNPLKPLPLLPSLPLFSLNPYF